MNSNYKFHIISQAKTNYNLSYNDYYPYGMLVPTRNYSNPVYRYGFQGQEKDNEIKGIGNSINYKFRMYDTRVGRFFAVDPLTAKYPWYTPYQFSGNKVIAFVELEGKEELYVVAKYTNTLPESDHTLLGYLYTYGPFLINPQFDKNDKLVSYIAYRKNRIEWIMHPNEIGNFLKNIDLYSNIGNLVYSHGEPSKADIEYSMGHYSKALKMKWHKAVRSPEWWMMTISAFGGAMIDIAESGSIIKSAVEGPTNVKGWKVGQSIRNLTKKGNIPSWSAVR